jgi:PAS domain S-box-containing protein
MPKNSSLKQKSTSLPSIPGRTAGILNRPFALGMLAFFILAALFSILIYQRHLILKQTEKKAAYDMANATRNKLQEALAFSSSAAKIMSFFVDNDGTVRNFDSVAAQILSTNRDIDILELVPDGVIQYVYPLKGNENIVGYNILKDPNRSKEAYKAIERNEMFFSGPYELRQGGVGIVGRLPVFRKGKFWGFSATVLKMSTLLKAAGIDSSARSGYAFQLSKLNPDTREEELFIPQGKEVSGDYAVSVNIPNGEWKLSVMPAGPGKGFTNLYLFAVIGFLFSVLGGIFVFIVAGRPEALDKLVKERTQQLKESEENYKVLFQKSPLPLWIYDLENFTFLEVNDAAVNVYGYSSDEFLRMKVTDIRPVEDVDAFVENSGQGTDELRASGVWTHIKKNRDDIQVLIFSRNIFYKGRKGRLVLVMDVSEKIKVENELIKSEEKYRSLIEQASDGIILYSFDGTIHSFNKAAYTQTGYSKEEFEKLNLKELFFEEDFDRKRSNNSKITTGQPATLYRKLKRKDGSAVNVELNARMLPDGKIFAIARDITEREKTEAALKESEEKFSKAFHSSLLGLGLYDADFRIVDTNEVYAGILESKRDALLGKTADEAGMMSKVHHGKRNAYNERMDELFEKEGRLSNFEMEIETSKGGATIMVSMEPLQLQDKHYWLTSAIDITDRKKAEEEINESNKRIDLIAQATNDAIWDHDLVNNLTWGNRKLYSIYGFEFGKEKIDFEMFLSRIHPEERQGIEERMLKAIDEKVTSLSEEFRFKTASGEYRTFYDRAYIKYDENKNPVRIMGAMNDITDRETIRQQIVKEKELSDSIINSLPGIFYLYTSKRKFLRWNKNFEIVTGYSAEEISDMAPLDFFDGADRDLMEAKIENVFVSGEDYAEADLLLKNGQKMPYYFTGQSINYEGETCLMGVGLDFSEKEKAAKIIKQSEEKYRTIIDQASDGIFIADPNAYFIDVNSAGCRMLGYTKEELLKIRFTELIPESDVVANPPKFEELKRSEAVINERRLIKKDGTLIDVEISAKTLSDGRYQSIVRDITERKKANIALAESEERYRALVENAPEALVVMDLEKQAFVSVSESAARLFKMPKHELLKIGPVQVSPEYQPDGRLSADAARDYLQKAMDGEKPSFEWTHCDSTGSLIPCEIWLVRLPSENKVLVRGSIVDITDRKKAAEKIQLSEQKYRLLFYNNPLPMWMTAIPNLEIIDVNESAIIHYGYSREEFLKLNAKDLRPPEDVEYFINEVNNMDPQTNNVRTWRHKKKDGTIINVEIYSHQIFYEGQRVWLGLANDVTEKYKARELLQKSYEDIRQLASNLQSIREDERTNIAREIHDELGQQLTGLKMDMHWLTRKIKSTDEEVNKKMEESIQLINATITSVRKIATDLRPSILDDLGLLAALEWQSDEFEKRSGTRVKFMNDAGEINVQPGVATALFRIYQELLTNIARHANANLVTVSLHTDNGKLFFSIADNGEGFNLDTINKKKTLGLLGIKERTLLMGGTYEIKTKPGEGSEITISIPFDLAKTMA